MSLKNTSQKKWWRYFKCIIILISRTHTNERPYPCTQCSIAFKTQSNLYKHCRSRTHALKVEQGIDSSSTDIVAELGDSFTDELALNPERSANTTGAGGSSTDSNRIHHHVQHQQNSHQGHPVVKTNIINLSQGSLQNRLQPAHLQPAHHPQQQVFILKSLFFIV